MQLAVDSSVFKDLFANWPSGVAAITCIGEDGAPQGFTASSVISVSLDPPLVLFALKRDSRSMAHFAGANSFAVNALSQDQDDISTLFATPGAERFRDVSYEAGPVTGAPLLTGAWGRIECEMYAQHDGGDHVIFLGKVVSITHEDAEPLVYHRRGYRSVAERQLDGAEKPTGQNVEAATRN